MAGTVSFSGNLTLREIPGASTANGRAEWVDVCDTLTFRDTDGETITFGPGATTDLGSTPEFSWSFGFSPDGIGVRAYTIHDLLYRTKGLCVWQGMTCRSRATPYTRAEADEILRKGLIACGVAGWRARVIWAAVRVGGSSGWGN